MAIDWLILEKIQQIFGSGFCDWFMPRITVLGNAGIIWIIIGVAMLISKKYRKYGVLVLAGLLIGLIIGNGIVKNVVQRARPCWIDTNFKMLIAIPKDYSFPSGHTHFERRSGNAARIRRFCGKKENGSRNFDSICFNRVFKNVFICAFPNRYIGRSSSWNNNRCVNICIWNKDFKNKKRIIHKIKILVI